MHLQSEKVTSTCSQRFAELDPYCPGMLEAACKSSRAGADASRLSLEASAPFSAFEQTLCRQSLRGVATLGQMVPEVQIWCAVNLRPCEPLPRRGSHDLSYKCR